MEANGDGAAADPSEIRPALAQLAATSLDAMQRALLDAGVELPVPDVFATAFMNEITAIQREGGESILCASGLGELSAGERQVLREALLEQTG